MPIKRQIAVKVRIIDLMSGEWVKKEGMEPSFVKTAAGVEVSRARIMATVVSQFMAEDGMFASVTLDDGTDTIRVKTFKTTKPLDTLKVGNSIDFIGKVREWNEEVYLMPEILNPIKDPNLELLRRAELLKGPAPAPSNGEAKPEPANEKDTTRKEIISLLDANTDGITYKDILAKFEKPEEVEPVINELLAEGICYEPTPGKVKKI